VKTDVIFSGGLVVLQVDWLARGDPVSEFGQFEVTSVAPRLSGNVRAFLGGGLCS